MSRTFLLLAATVCLLVAAPAAEPQEEAEKTREWFKAKAKRWHETGDNCPRLCGTCRREVDRLDQALFHADLQAVKENYSVAHPVSAIMIGLASMAQGDSLSRGNRRMLASYVKFVTAQVLEERDGPLLWGLPYGVLFLTEIYLKDPSDELKKTLEEAYRRIRERQRPGGGWTHMFGYEIVGFTNQMAVALGRLEACGIEVEDAVKDRIVRYYENCIRKNGGLPYSLSNVEKQRERKEKGQPPMPVINLGLPATAARNAGAILALMEIGATDTEVYRKIVGYFDTHLRDVIFGWGSTQLHILNAGVAAYRLGDRYWDRFRKEILSLADHPRPNGWSKYKLYYDETVRMILLLLERERLAFARRDGTAQEHPRREAQRKRGRLALFSAMLGVAAHSERGPAPVPGTVPAGVRYLLDVQSPDGSWGADEVSYQTLQPAITALVFLGLRTSLDSLEKKEAGGARDALARAKKYMMEVEVTAGPMRKYEDRCRSWNNPFMLLTLLYLRRTDGERPDARIRELVSAVERSQEKDGGWTYSSNWHPKLKKSTSFQTSMVLIALLEARHAGFEVSEKVMERAREALKAMRRPDGTYRY
ncbi:MAG: prenyltransferase/squalene oxidase repeat-containing protein, partial [Planctomycetota bacterium]